MAYEERKTGREWGKGVRRRWKTRGISEEELGMRESEGSRRGRVELTCKKKERVGSDE